MFGIDKKRDASEDSKYAVLAVEYKEKLNEKTLECSRLLSEKSKMKEIFEKFKIYKTQNELTITKLKSERDKFEEIARKNCDAYKKLHKRTLEIKNKSDWAGPSEYEKLLASTLKQFESLMQCPISFDDLENPMVLPSGNTVNKGVLQTLIEGRKPDPFDRNKVCRKLIVNRFATETAEILDKIQKEKSILDVSHVDSKQNQKLEQEFRELENSLHVSENMSIVYRSRLEKYEKELDFKTKEIENLNKAPSELKTQTTE